jgi:NADPH:quinone reductase-like Zn-dependent oxidoreductase
MRAVVLRGTGGPENLRLESVPDPTPEPGEVVVRLRAAALNHRDVWIRKGLYAGIRLPVILGSDGAGELEDGRRVVINPGFDWGDDPRAHGPNFRILGLPDDGTYAEMVKVPAGHVHAFPADWSWEEAAALPLAGLTAYRALVTRAAVRAGEWVLITGIGGGVSQLALQIARALGARAFVTSGSDDKIARAASLGAFGGVNYRQPDWVKQLVAITGGGPDVVIDSVGGETLNQAVEAVKPGGRIVSYGATTGAVPRFEVRRLFWKQVSLLGSTMGTPAEFRAMLDLFEQHALRPTVDQAFPLADAAAAHRRMEEAGQFGKIVLRV